MGFRKATKKKAKLRLGLIGPSGTGKTFTALSVARGLVGPNGRIAVRDSEAGSADKYADLFDFDSDAPTSHSPQAYRQAIDEAVRLGYDAIILDSLSHAWAGKDGALEMVDAAAVREKGNSYAAWRHVTPEHNALVEKIISAPIHIIATLRAKTEFVKEVNEKTGKTEIRKVGLAPIQRDGMEYEFDVVGDMDQDNVLAISKTRCPALKKAVIREPGEEFGKLLRDWLLSGVSADRPTTSEQPVLVGPAKGDKDKGKPAARIFELTDAMLEATIAACEKAVQDGAAAEAAGKPPSWMPTVRLHQMHLQAERSWRIQTMTTAEPVNPLGDDTTAAHAEGNTPVGTGAQEPEQQPAPADADATPSTVILDFGPHKGKLVADLTDGELGASIDEAQAKLQERPKAFWSDAMRRSLTALEMEVEIRKRATPQPPAAKPEETAAGATRRQRAPRASRAESAPAAREPGSDDGEEARAPH